MKGVSINTIIENSPFRNEKINLLSIDIENYEFEALKNLIQQYNRRNCIRMLIESLIKLLIIFRKITNSKIYELLTKIISL